MTHLIDKDAIIAEIKRRIDSNNEMAASFSSNSEHGYLCRVKEAIYESLLSFINTLEVKEVENTELLKVKGYLVRDKDDYTAIYAEKPHRGKTEWIKGNDSCLMTINDARLVPDIEFEDEPVEVKVTLERV